MLRYGMLARKAVELGHEIVWWTDDFDHFHKKHRFGEDRKIEAYSGCTIQFIHTRGYERNASLSRFRDHRILAQRFERLAGLHVKPDAILAGMPTDHFCVSAVKIGKQYGIPVILDVRDLWPDVFYRQVPVPLRPMLWLATRSFDRRISWAFARADSIIGNTEPFVKWGLKKARRCWRPADKVVPIGYQEPTLSGKEWADGYEFWREHGVRPDDGVFTICFFGSMGPMYNFQPVLKAARSLQDDEIPVRFVLCGKGDQLGVLRRKARRLKSVLLPGWVNQGQIASLMRMSHLGLAPYRDDPNFRMNLPNKPAEYLSASLPFLTGIDGVMHDLVRKHVCGQRYTSGEQLASAIRSYRDHPTRLKQERQNARRLFQEMLDADIVYADFIAHLDSLVEKSRRQAEGVTV